MSIFTALGGYGLWKIKCHSSNTAVAPRNENYREIFTDNKMDPQIVFDDITKYKEIAINASFVPEKSYIHGF